MWKSVPGAGVLSVRNNLILMVLHERNGEYRWELPSGVVEPGESFEQTAARETLEETGIRVSVGKLLCTAVMDEPEEHYRGINAYFRVETLDGRQPENSSSRENISSVAYVDLMRLSAREIHPVDRRILGMWRRDPDRPPFHVYIRL